MKTRRRAEDAEAIAELAARAASLSAEARENKAKGDAIEDAAFDLKAVNPNAPPEETPRTPQELLAIIREKGREAEEALTSLELLLSQ